jgi:hypothetical protein
MSLDFSVVLFKNYTYVDSNFQVTQQLVPRPHVVVQMIPGFFWAIPITKESSYLRPVTTGVDPDYNLRTNSVLKFSPSFLQNHAIQLYQDPPIVKGYLRDTASKHALLEFILSGLSTTAISGRFLQCNRVHLWGSFLSMTVLVLSSDKSGVNPCYTFTPVFSAQPSHRAIEILQMPVNHGDALQPSKLYVPREYAELDHHWIDLNYIYTYASKCEWVNSSGQKQPIYEEYEDHPVLTSDSIISLYQCISQIINAKVLLTAADESSLLFQDKEPPDWTCDGQEAEWEWEWPVLLDLNSSLSSVQLCFKAIDLTYKSEQASVDEGEYEEEYWGDEGLHSSPPLLNLNTELEIQRREQSNLIPAVL